MVVRPGATVTFIAMSDCVNDVARCSWRMDCFSTRLRLKQYCLAPISSVKGFDSKQYCRWTNSGAVSWQCQAALIYIESSVTPSSFTLDSTLTMDQHVTQVVRSCNYHAHALRHIRPLLILEVAKMLAHSIVSSRLDYANALLHGTSDRNLGRFTGLSGLSWKMTVDQMFVYVLTQVQKYARPLMRPQLIIDNSPVVVEEYTFETERRDGRVNMSRLVIMQRLSDESYLGTLYVDRDFKDSDPKGNACRLVFAWLVDKVWIVISQGIYFILFYYEMYTKYTIKIKGKSKILGIQHLNDKLTSD